MSPARTDPLYSTEISGVGKAPSYRKSDRTPSSLQLEHGSVVVATAPSR